MSPPSRSRRWCPTPEQLMVLEELYRRGLTNPIASQIQKITAHLSFYGKIQGRNVFYWFQNHKARDRQKLRKKLYQQQLLQQYQHQHAPSAFHQLFNCYFTQNLYPQGTGSHEKGLELGIMKQTWRADVQEDCFTRTDGHDLMMILDAGPTFHCCKNKPLKTLELFPLQG